MVLLRSSAMLQAPPPRTTPEVTMRPVTRPSLPQLRTLNAHS